MTNTVPGIANMIPQATFPQKIPPPPLGQKGKVHLTKVPHPQPPSRSGLQTTYQDTQGILLLLLTLPQRNSL